MQTKKFVNVFVRALTKSDVTGFCKSTYRLKICYAKVSLIYCFCANTLNRFGLKLYGVINYSDITSPTCPHEYTRKVCFTDV